MSEKTDYLIMSLLCIPQVNREFQQKEENRFKVGLLISSSGVVPERKTLLNIVNGQVLDFASQEIKDLYNTIEKDFNLLNFAKRAEGLLKYLEQNQNLKQFLSQIQNNLIFKGLHSARQIFKSVKVNTLMNLLYVKEDKLEKVILKAQAYGLINVKINHEKQVIVFQDEHQENLITESLKKIINFNEQLRLLDQEINANDNVDQAFKQSFKYLQNSEKVLEQRDNVAETFKEYLRKIDESFDNDEKNRLKKEMNVRKQQELENRIQKEEQAREMDRRKVELNKKKKIIQEMIQIKGNWQVMIEGKKIEHLNDQDVDILNEKVLRDEKTQLEIRLKENIENKEHKDFQKCDYIKRAIREQQNIIISSQWNQENDSKLDIIQIAQKNYENNLNLKKQLIIVQKLKENYLGKIEQDYDRSYKIELSKFQEQITKQFKEQILKEAKDAYDLDQENREKAMKEAPEQQASLNTNDRWRPSQTSQKPGDIKSTDVQRNDFPAEKQELGAGFDFRSNKPQEKKVVQEPKFTAPQASNDAWGRKPVENKEEKPSDPWGRKPVENKDEKPSDGWGRKPVENKDEKPSDGWGRKPVEKKEEKKAGPPNFFRKQ